MERIEQISVKRGYVVTEEGKLLNPKGDEVGVIKSTGYMGSMIRISGKRVWHMTHRLQAYQKYGDKLFEEGIVVRHKDGDSLNNSWDNILIGTSSDNMMDIPKQIRIKKAQHASSFLRKYDKKEVQEFHKIDTSYEKTMVKFGITSTGTLHYILNN